MSDEKEPQQEHFTARYDFARDVLTVHNIRYAGELLRRIHVAPVGSFFELVAREDGVLTLRSVNHPERDAAADAEGVIDQGGAIIVTIAPEKSLKAGSP